MEKLDESEQELDKNVNLPTALDMLDESDNIFQENTSVDIVSPNLFDKKVLIE